jgi:tRNA (mo5U34)-methyltransferase
MAAKRLRLPGGITVTVDRDPRRRARTTGGSTGALRFLEPTPQPRPQRRDVKAAVHFLGGDGTTVERDGPDEQWSGIEDHFWYHTIDLPDGSTTPGAFDHRAVAPHIGLPADMTGMSALDIATFDGFWAFEMERRGAEVTALDVDSTEALDLPRRVRDEAVVPTPVFGRGFELAHRLRGSSVKKVVGSVYDLDPDRIGTFDLVHIADLLVHLRRPLDALEAVRGVTRREALIVDAVDPSTGRGEYGDITQYLGGWDDVVWWVPSLDMLAQLVIDAGFSDLRVNVVYELAKTSDTRGLWRASMTATV